MLKTAFLVVSLTMLAGRALAALSALEIQTQACPPVATS